MIINSIEFNNFRQYRNVKANLRPKNGKNISVIHGQNGTGKTTFRQGVIWALYGPSELELQGELLNIKTQEEMKNYDIADVYILLDVSNNGKQYMIKRTQKYQATSSSIERKDMILRMSYTTETGETEILEGDDAQSRINSILPKHFRRYFFHSSEAISSDKLYNNLKESVRDLTGLQLQEKILKHLAGGKNMNPATPTKGSVLRILQENIDGNSEEFEKKNIAFDTLSAELEDFEQRYDRVKESIANCESGIKKLDDILRDKENSSNIQNDLDVKRGELDSLKKEITHKQLSLIKYLGNQSIIKHYFYTLSEEKVNAVIGDVPEYDQGLGQLNGQTIDYLLERGKCICGEVFVSGDNHYSNLVQVKKTVPPESLAMASFKLKTEIENAKTQLQVHEEHFKDNFKQIDKLEEEMDILNNTINNLDSKLRNLGDTGELFVMRDTESKRKDELNQQLGEIRTNIQQKQNEMDNIDKELKKLTISNDKNTRINELISYGRELSKKLHENLDKKDREALEEIREYADRMYNNLMTNSDTFIEISDNFEISINTHSGAATQTEGHQITLRNLAFIYGLIQTAKKQLSDKNRNHVAEFMTILDAPFSNLDENVIKALCEELGHFSDQVILLVKGDNWAFAKDAIKEFTCSEYVISQVLNQNNEGCNEESVLKEVTNDF